jgi:hypothetical protein
MGHWACMGIAWGNIEDGQMGPKHSLGCISRAWAARASKHTPGRPPKLDMFWWVVGFEGHISWHAIFDQRKWTSDCHWYVSLLRDLCCSCVKTHANPPQSEQRIYDLSLKERQGENICSSTGGAQEKRKDRMKLSLPPKLMILSVWSPHRMLMYFFAGFFLISPCVCPNSGFWCCIFLMDNSIG